MRDTFIPCSTMARIKCELQFKHEYMKFITRRQISSNNGTVYEVRATLKWLELCGSDRNLPGDDFERALFGDDGGGEAVLERAREGGGGDLGNFVVRDNFRDELD